MGYDIRRGLKKHISHSIFKSKAWIVITWDGEGTPILSMDLTRCAKNPTHPGSKLMGFVVDNTNEYLKAIYEHDLKNPAIIEGGIILGNSNKPKMERVFMVIMGYFYMVYRTLFFRPKSIKKIFNQKS
jgi:hypothetical protein